MKDMNKKGFTLVELLAVIVILAVILVIAVPKITDVIDNTKKSSIESTLKMIATTAEKEYTTREMLGTLDQANNPIGCTDVVKLSNNDYSTCNIRFNEGVATVSLSGNGKLKDYRLVGTKDNINTVTSNNTYSEPILNGAYPRLDEGMIPVTIANDGTVRTVDPSSSSWYSYTNKAWANAVLVKETGGAHTREYYQTNYNVNVTLTDILAYFVWIPRYRYELFNAEGNAISPISIQITFESADTNKNIETTTGEELTHPAFTYDGMELNGIWVGKFETTGTGAIPTIMPNVSSLRSQNVSTQFETSLKFSSNYYGLNNESRMMKNNEWGAVAYLSHSVYGINDEVRINNNNGFKTGCGASAANGGATAECQIAYGSDVAAYPQSTTGNISGIFDMSGGAWEYVMGVLEDSNDNSKGRSGHSGMYYTKAEWIAAMQSNESTFTSWYGAVTAIGEYNSGYNGLTYIPAIGSTTINSYYKTNGKNFPNNKYYKIYSGTNWNANEEYLGEALGETRGWYSDYQSFVSVTYPWFIRGGRCSSGAGAGLFSFNTYSGHAGSHVSFRVVSP